MNHLTQVVIHVNSLKQINHLFPKQVLIHNTLWNHYINKHEFKKNGAYKLHASDQSFVP